MQAELQGLERPAGEHELAVQHEAVFCDIAKAARDLGKVPLERLLVPGLQVNPLAATVGDAAKAIVLRLVLPSFPEGSSSTASASIGGRSRGSGAEGRFTGFNR